MAWSGKLPPALACIVVFRNMIIKGVLAAKFAAHSTRCGTFWWVVASIVLADMTNSSVQHYGTTICMGICFNRRFSKALRLYFRCETGCKRVKVSPPVWENA